MNLRTNHSPLGALPPAAAVHGAVLSFAPLPVQHAHRTLLRCSRALISGHGRAARLLCLPDAGHPDRLHAFRATVDDRPPRKSKPQMLTGLVQPEA